MFHSRRRPPCQTLLFIMSSRVRMVLIPRECFELPTSLSRKITYSQTRDLVILGDSNALLRRLHAVVVWISLDLEIYPASLCSRAFIAFRPCSVFGSFQLLVNLAAFTGGTQNGIPTAFASFVGRLFVIGQCIFAIWIYTHTHTYDCHVKLYLPNTLNIWAA